MCLWSARGSREASITRAKACSILCRRPEPGSCSRNSGLITLGPFDGHNLKVVIDVLRSAKNWAEEGPILIHLLTVKGKGFEPAEGAPVSYHGVGSFDPNLAKADKLPDAVNGDAKKKTSYTDIFSDALLELGVTDPRIVAITAAMAEGTGLDKFRDRIPERFFDVGIAEQFAVTYAAGMATSGLKPVLRDLFNFSATRVRSMHPRCRNPETGRLFSLSTGADWLAPTVRRITGLST